MSACFNVKGKIENCPLCGNQLSELPTTIEEASQIDYQVGKPGITIRFGRRPPLR